MLRRDYWINCLLQCLKRFFTNLRPYSEYQQNDLSSHLERIVGRSKRGAENGWFGGPVSFAGDASPQGAYCWQGHPWLAYPRRRASKYPRKANQSIKPSWPHHISHLVKEPHQKIRIKPKPECSRVIKYHTKLPERWFCSNSKYEWECVSISMVDTVHHLL